MIYILQKQRNNCNGPNSIHCKDNRSFAVKQRLQLFNATVTAVMLYGAGTWTLKSADLGRMQSEQRKMLRMMLQTPRRVVEQKRSAEDTSESDEGEENQEADETEDESSLLLEDWISWVKRATHVA